MKWDEIVSIKRLGREKVWDIGIEGTHNFVGNGILAHNTYIESGNVGIGTASPGNKLDVSGALAVGSSYAGTALPAAAANGMAINGNVGIGTTGPQSKLEVSVGIFGSLTAALLTMAWA